ncbi:MAG: fructose-bisphosphate aldolase class I [Acidimicrobiales bacterium]|jgi:fructose-bisphosphate aldolase class I
MSNNEKLHEIAKTLVSPRKGILAADQSPRTMNRQLEALGLAPEAEVRRKYRQLLLSTPGIEEYVTGVILHDGTIRNHDDDGTQFSDVLISKGIIPIIKVDKSTVPHAGFEGEVVTQGLDELGNRLQEYYDMGARAAKWRAVFTISETTPTEQNILFDCMSLARYAKLCQETGIVPIVEPEVLFSGVHSMERAEEVTTAVLQKLFDMLQWYKVDLEGVILKSSMVLAGSEFAQQSTAKEVAEATLRTFRNSVPETVPGIVFLSGGQTPQRATENLDAIAEREGREKDLPWELAFSFSRGLEQPVQEAWQGKDENIPAAQAALLERLLLNSMADQGTYEPSME